MYKRRTKKIEFISDVLLAVAVASGFWLGLAFALSTWDYNKLLFFRVGDIQYFNAFLTWHSDGFIYALPNLSFLLPAIIVYYLGPFGFFVLDLIIFYLIFLSGRIYGRYFNTNIFLLPVLLLGLFYLSVNPYLWQLVSGIVDLRITFPFVSTTLTVIVGLVYIQTLRSSHASIWTVALIIIIGVIFLNIYQYISIFLFLCIFIITIEKIDKHLRIVMLCVPIISLLTLKSLPKFFHEYESLYGVVEIPFEFKAKVMEALWSHLISVEPRKFLTLSALALFSTFFAFYGTTLNRSLRSLGLVMSALLSPFLTVLVTDRIGQLNHLPTVIDFSLKLLVYSSLMVLITRLINTDGRFMKPLNSAIVVVLVSVVGLFGVNGFIWGYYFSAPRIDAFGGSSQRLVSRELLELLDKVDSISKSNMQVLSDDPVINYYSRLMGVGTVLNDVLSVEDHKGMLNRYFCIVQNDFLVPRERAIDEFYLHAQPIVPGNIIWYLSHNKGNNLNRIAATPDLPSTKDINYLQSWDFNFTVSYISAYIGKETCTTEHTLGPTLIIGRGNFIKALVKEQCGSRANYLTTYSVCEYKKDVTREERRAMERGAL